MFASRRKEAAAAQLARTLQPEPVPFPHVLQLVTGVAPTTRFPTKKWLAAHKSASCNVRGSRLHSSSAVHVQRDAHQVAVTTLHQDLAASGKAADSSGTKMDRPAVEGN